MNVTQSENTGMIESHANVKGGIANAIDVMEEYLRATASLTGEKIGALRERLEDQIKVCKDRIGETTEVLVEKTKEAARATDDYVNDNPWRAMGIAVGVGFIIGMLTGRRNY